MRHDFLPPDFWKANEERELGDIVLMRTMETKLRILTDASTRSKFIAALNQGLIGCWSSSPIALKAAKEPNFEIHSFTYTGDARGYIELGLRAEDDGSLLACEIWDNFGQETGLTEGEKSLVRMDFCRQAEPIADALGIEVHVSRIPVDIEDVLDPPEVSLLKKLKFSVGQGVDRLHTDEDWHTFVVETYRKGLELSAEDLRDWLIGKKWDGQSVDVLTRAYSFGHALLRLYEVVRGTQ